jgi:hypothetical protein
MVSLLNLPAELRNEIYDYALTSETGFLQYRTKTKRFDVSCIGAGLLTTCRSISAETLCLPIRLNKLVFDVTTRGNFDVWLLLARLDGLEQAAQYGLGLDLRLQKL